MIGRLAVRSLTAHPLRSGVLAAGFGVGVGVMAILLGVAQVVLEQSRAPALVGGGDVIVLLSPQVPGRLVLSGTLQSDALRPRIRAAAPTHTASLFLLHDGRAARVDARGGIPSLERALGDQETSGIAAWRDSPDDMAWMSDTPEKVLRQIDRFHAIPEATPWEKSWAEWLYFNGEAAGARFYLTFIVGPARGNSGREAEVRLQLDRGGIVETFTERRIIPEAAVSSAPDLAIGANSVRLEGTRYRIHLDLQRPNGRGVRGDLALDASSDRPAGLLHVLLPPVEIRGARGWRTGYVVPVVSGALDGALEAGGDRVSLTGGTGYHDHNWGFWQGVSWRWGYVHHDGLSVLYGRLFAPPDAVNPERLRRFLGVGGPDGPLGYATDVSINETSDARGEPHIISVRARGADLDVQMTFTTESAVTTPAGGLAQMATHLDFFQLRGTYTVTGQAGGRTLNFTAPGSAETFRDR